MFEGEEDAWDTAFAAAIASARSLWPDLDLGDDDVGAYLRARVRPGGSLEFVAELALACGLADGRVRALEIFERDYAHVIRTAIARRLRAASEEVEDAIQSLRTLLFVAPPGRSPGIAKYAGRGPLRAWLKTVADRHALRILRDLGRPVTAGEDVLEAALAVAPDPELAYLRDRYREPFRRAISAAIAGLRGPSRALLQLRLRATPEAIAELYRVHRTTVIRRLVQAREELQAATRRHLMEDLSLREDELSSLIRLVRSDLSAMLQSQLEPAKAP